MICLAPIVSKELDYVSKYYVVELIWSRTVVARLVAHRANALKVVGFPVAYFHPARCEYKLSVTLQVS